MLRRTLTCRAAPAAALTHWIEVTADCRKMSYVKDTMPKEAAHALYTVVDTAQVALAKVHRAATDELLAAKTHLSWPSEVVDSNFATLMELEPELASKMIKSMSKQRLVSCLQQYLIGKQRSDPHVATNINTVLSRDIPLQPIQEAIINKPEVMRYFPQVVVTCASSESPKPTKEFFMSLYTLAMRPHLRKKLSLGIVECFPALCIGRELAGDETFTKFLEAIARIVSKTSSPELIAAVLQLDKKFETQQKLILKAFDGKQLGVYQTTVAKLLGEPVKK
ncbi:hypothetical protein DIPPA_23381 [Diplonema papillatum]|nr:hypothetical protein DIPPA_23381 [Diplonema papillatum]